MKHCVLCAGLIWPWHHFGFQVSSTGTRYWHAPRCARAATARRPLLER